MFSASYSLPHHQTFPSPSLASTPTPIRWEWKTHPHGHFSCSQRASTPTLQPEHEKRDLCRIFCVWHTPPSPTCRIWKARHGGTFFMFFMLPTNRTCNGRAEGHEKGLRAKVHPLNLSYIYFFWHFPAQTPPPVERTETNGEAKRLEGAFDTYHIIYYKKGPCTIYQV